jgi:hypothetical protein
MVSIGGNLPTYFGNTSTGSYSNPQVWRANRSGAGASGEGDAQQPAADAGNGTANPAASDGPNAATARQGQPSAAKGSVGATGSASTASQDPQLAAEIARLQTTDRAVRAHEAAHVAAGGSYVQGAASFTYQTGPDGQQYAVGGEVSIDVSAERTPEATIQKMEIVRAAALAPADPSATDRAVAASATQAETAARAEMNAAQAETTTAAAQGAGASPELPTEGMATAERETTQAAETAGAGTAAQNGLGNLVRQAYAAANTPWAAPAFQVAA